MHDWGRYFLGLVIFMTSCGTKRRAFEAEQVEKNPYASLQTGPLKEPWDLWLNSQSLLKARMEHQSKAQGFFTAFPDSENDSWWPLFWAEAQGYMLAKNEGFRDYKGGSCGEAYVAGLHGKGTRPDSLNPPAALPSNFSSASQVKAFVSGICQSEGIKKRNHLGPSEQKSRLLFFQHSPFARRLQGLAEREIDLLIVGYRMKLDERLQQKQP